MVSALSKEVAHALLKLGGALPLLEAQDKDLECLAVPIRLRSAIKQYQSSPDKYQVLAEDDVSSLSKLSAGIITWLDDSYPKGLREIVNPPVLLCAKGCLEYLNTPQLAVVGSRKASPGGLESAFELACQLAASGLTINSGLAHGIDAAAHRGALSVPGGSTVAVLGTGIDLVYPRNHVELRNQIGQQGLVLSEFPPGMPPRSSHFPRRNRIISGMSLGVLLIEAAERSGSLITARLAREQDREVFAVPGSINNPLNRGCHALIRSGAKLVETRQDVLEEISAQFKPASIPNDHDSTPTQPASSQEISAELRILLQAVGFEPTTSDLTIARTHLDAATVASGLAMLELKGLIKRTHAGYVRMERFGL
jgi:DNA processing protein